MRGMNKTLLATLIGIGVLVGCNSDSNESNTLPTSETYPLSSYGVPELCGNGQSWASDAEVVALQTQVELAESGDVITLPAGCFKMTAQLTVSNKNNLVLRGSGIDKTYLDFSNVGGSTDGISISSGTNITISDLQVSEASKNGIKADNIDGLIIRDVAAIWLEVPRQRNESGSLRGTYGLYPVNSKNVLIEDTWSYGSADAGIYVGQTIGAVLRYNVAEMNIAGLEVENSSSVDVYDNLALGNTGGILLFDLPGATTIGRMADDVRFFNNTIRDNNLENYVDSTCGNGVGGCGVVGVVPPGTGIVILSGSNGEFFNNTITNHDSMAVAMTSYLLVNSDPAAYTQLDFNPETGVVKVNSETGAIVEGWNPVPTNMYFHDNVIENVGSNPNGPLIEDMVLAYNSIHNTFPAIFYDGAGESLIRAKLFSELQVGLDGLNIGGALNPASGNTNWDYLTNFTEADSNCVINNTGASVGILVDNTTGEGIMRYMANPANADFLYDNSDNNLLVAGCASKQSLAINSITIDGKEYGHNIDDPDAETPIVPDTPKDIVGNNFCTTAGTDINWKAINRPDAYFGENCVNLSDYRLFEESTDPTKNLNITGAGKGTPYDMNVELFTDYARKYRFVVMPDGTQAQYREQEVLELPIGTVLIKTFVLPSDTSNAAGVNEEIIETRLLIRRYPTTDNPSGWVALPYVWNDTKTDATLSAVAVPLQRTIKHDGVDLPFTYEVPSRNQCTLCHNNSETIADTDVDGNAVTQGKGFLPIGPKVRNMNSLFDFGNGDINQLTQWENLRLLTLPSGRTVDALPKTPELDTEDGLTALELADLSDSEIADFTKAYLDVNCAHCHRTGGKQETSPIKFEYWNPGNTLMGICAQGVTYDDQTYIVNTASADDSALRFRLNLASGNMMPELGRHLVHKEGIELIDAWIGTLGGQPCPD